MLRMVQGRLARLCAASFLLAACGSNSPTSPSTGTTSNSGATISGTVTAGSVAGATASSTSNGIARPLSVTSATPSISGLSVKVVGTNLSTAVGPDGRFEITGVPSGNVKLQFSGGGVDAMATVANVTGDQFIEIQVLISGTAASILADSREGKVTMCHAEGNGSYHPINVSDSAEPAHRAHGDGKVGELVPGQSTLRFDESCRAAGPSVDIETFTNGADADTPPGPSVVVGTAVAWSYVVKNTGTVALTNVVVTDSRSVPVNCHSVTSLAAGASVQCDASGTATLGQYSNVGSVAANWSMGSASGTVTDSDASNYLGVAAASSGENGSKVTLCHRTGAGRYNTITVDRDAEPAHRAHGDARPGEAVPDMGGKIFGADCSVN